MRLVLDPVRFFIYTCKERGGSPCVATSLEVLTRDTFMPADRNKGNNEHQIYVARQPIFTRNKKVYGYELLFRSSLDNYFDVAVDGDFATSQVLSNSFLMIGIEKMTAGKKAFINFSEEMLMKELPALFPKALTVVEILEDVKPTPDVVTACENLAEKGYVLALDDFLYKDEFIPLLEMAKLVKFDIRAMSREQLRRHVLKVKPYDVKLLAEKVETFNEFQETLNMGFDLFQGYFFCKPNIVEGRDIPGSKIQYLRVLQELQDENYDFTKIGDLISHDVGLTYKLLKYINSAAMATRVKIQSLQGAIALLGEVNLRKWLNLTMISYLAEDKPLEVLRLSIQRAVFCEEVGKRVSRHDDFSKKCFMVGLLSLLDVLLDKPLAEVLPELNLGADLQECLLEKPKDRLGYTLLLAKAYERGAWSYSQRAADLLPISLADLPACFDVAVETANSFSEM